MPQTHVGVRIPLLNPRTSALLIFGVRSGEGVVLKSDREVREVLAFIGGSHREAAPGSN